MDDFDEYGDWDSMSCAEGDYNAFEDEQVFQDTVAEGRLGQFESRQLEAVEVHGDRATCVCGEAGIITETYTDERIDMLFCDSCGDEWEVFWG